MKHFCLLTLFFWLFAEFWGEFEGIFLT